LYEENNRIEEGMVQNDGCNAIIQEW
jgi:hypothetical protein